jgi:hypothetical protein
MCIGPCIVVINEDEEPTRCYLVFYCTYERINMFQGALCPPSGAHDYTADYHMGLLILRLLIVGRLVLVGWLSVRLNHQQPKNQMAHVVISGTVVSS